MEEVQLDQPEDITTWRRSSYSSANGQCVEVADGLTGIVPVRDSKAPESVCLMFKTEAWSSFITNLKAGEHSCPERTVQLV